MTIPTIKLLHGADIPVLGLGTYPMDDAESAAAVRSAVELGYRLFDTAENYGNEAGVGQGVRECGLPREELFVTTKFNKEWHSVDGARKAWQNGIERMRLDYIDLLLIHWPNPEQNRYVEAFRGLLELLRDGSVRAIGTSNFKPRHLQRLLDETGEAPDVNQIQLSPYTTRDDARAFATQHKIITQSWSPIKNDDLLTHPTLTGIAEELGRTTAQIVLRWHFQLGLITVPKTTNAARMAENAAIFDFTLTDEQMAAISALDKGEGAARDSDEFGH